MHYSVGTIANFTIDTVVMDVLGVVDDIREGTMMAFLFVVVVVVIAFACFRVCLPRAWKPACHCKGSQCR